MFADTFFRLNFSETIICPGNTLTFECTVTEGHDTVWKGSALDCDESDDVIQLLYSRLNTTFKRSCNNENILVQILYIKDNCYTSQLSVMITSSMTGKTVKCARDNGTSEEVVGIYTINNGGDSVCANLSDGISEPTLIVTGT